MFFYAVMAVVLLLRLPMVVTVSVLLVLAVAAGSFVPVDVMPLTVLHPIVLVFVAGMWLALLAGRGVRVDTQDRKSVVSGKVLSRRLNPGSTCRIKTKNILIN